MIFFILFITNVDNLKRLIETQRKLKENNNKKTKQEILKKNKRNENKELKMYKKIEKALSGLGSA